jgi:FKBP-type peptidyl-prolyl cis-trans isomerase SlyD
MKISKDMAVRLHVTLTTSDGQVIESSDKSGPVDYVHGRGAMLAGLERVLEGLEAGAEREGTIGAKDAFGTEASMPTKDIDRSEFGKEQKLELGTMFEAKGPDGRPVTLKVAKITDKVVTVRFMHPLAGKDLKYKVKVVAVKDPRKAAPPPPPAEALHLDAGEIVEEK